MTKPTLHFAYTIPLAPSRARRAVDKVLRLSHLPPLYRGAQDWFIPWRRPIRSPHCITYHLLRAFKQRYNVKLYNMYEHTRARLGQDDIFIGQPVPIGGFGPIRPDRDDPLSVTSQTVRHYPDHQTYVIMPYTHDPLYVSWTRPLLRDHRGGLILVGGEIWSEHWAEVSPLRDLPIVRKVHVPMGIDPADYPRVKQSFNPPGRRKYLYIGHTDWYKNTVELERIAAAIPNFSGGHIGGGVVKGWTKISDFASLTPELMSQLAREYDIFVNTSTADAQATTILEQMCFGFVVACTPESGYGHSSLIRLSTHDTAANVAALERLQQVPEDELRAIAALNRSTAEREHDWASFTSRITDFMGI